MTITSVLIANRGEIAIRIMRAAADQRLRAVAVFSEDDADALHVHRADAASALDGRGPAAYMDIGALIEAAKSSACDAIHPGYGFLSESAEFAERCLAAGLVFVGPRPETLELLGHKARARSLAERVGVPVPAGTNGPTTLDEARAFMSSLGIPVLVKAIAGGGGRGMRAVERPEDLAEAYERCASEAMPAFGSSDLYVEQRIADARHVEVQVLGDAAGGLVHLWERDCTLQRRHQKLIEIAPSPTITDEIRGLIIDAALRIAREVRLENAATFEFLVAGERWYFIEANPRLQVEHTITEELTGVDIVAAQLRIAGGDSLADLGLSQAGIVRRCGYAMQVRVNAETLGADGSVRPSAGVITAFEPPLGPAVRVDSCAYAGYAVSPAFDSLIAKVIVTSPSPDFADVLARAYRALGEFRIEGVATNIGLLQDLVSADDVAACRTHTRFVDEHIAAIDATSHVRDGRASARAGLAGARIDTSDPLAVLEHGKSGGGAGPAPGAVAEIPGMVPVRAPMQGTIVSVDVREGDLVRRGQRMLVMEAMKMEHIVGAPASGRVHAITAAAGDAVFEGHVLAHIEEMEFEADDEAAEERVDPDVIRADLAEARERHVIGLDEARPDAVARRRKTGQRTARENVADLCDEGSFVEYGPLVIAAQRRRRTVEDLIANTPADGLIGGIGTVNAELFGEDRSRCIAMSYDYTVLAGTQGSQNHRKKDRLFVLAKKSRLPIVFFTEGGGGRPGDTDGLGVAGLDCLAFQYFGELSGLVPLVGIVSGRCFAGNAALLGCCDVVIATKNANIGMGGPAMIEGGGLGVFRPEEVGPIDVQVRNGVVDIAVEDEAEAVRAAKQYLSYFQGATASWECADQRLLRSAIPENRRRVYDVRRVIETMADTGSVLELRRGFGAGMVTALARVEGRSVGIVANNPTHLAGAIDADGADKASRFMQLCDAFDVPLLFLCDTPGIMVGPEAEKTALVRHAARMFVTGASLTVPFVTIVLRKAYGLGAQAMAGGSFKAPFFTISWPTGEFGGMGLEGAVKLGYRNELAAIADPDKRRALYEEMVERMYRHGKAVNTASHFEIDDVIDPMESRRWITSALRSSPAPTPRAGKKRPSIDTW